MTHESKRCLCGRCRRMRIRKVQAERQERAIRAVERSVELLEKLTKDTVPIPAHWPNRVPDPRTQPSDPDIDGPYPYVTNDRANPAPDTPSTIRMPAHFLTRSIARRILVMIQYQSKDTPDEIMIDKVAAVLRGEE